MRKADFTYNILFFCLVFIIGTAHTKDTVFQKRIQLEENEQWWGGFVVDGPLMPFGDFLYSIELHGDRTGNQSQPLLVSNMGRYVWCEDPVHIEFKDDELIVSSKYSEIIRGKSGSTLREAFQFVSRQYFPASGKLPDSLLFIRPQYNTWIELMYDQNQADILKYANAIIENGFPPGVLMIDDNWQEDYGVWEFKAEKFPDPKAMIHQLHDLGFRVMLWVCPFVSADSREYRELKQKQLLIRKNTDQGLPAIIRWWNGASAVLDLTNPAAEQWFVGTLKELQKKYGVDGFKLDAGDAHFYTGEIKSFKQAHSNTHSELFARIGLHFPLNEYRACWKMGGQPLAQRLRDKSCDWNDLRKLIPGIVAQGLDGYAFTCPDMIGGGQFRSFLNLEKIDQELVVRSAQCHALMPMMQFSVAPWRVLDEKHLNIARSMAKLHAEFGPYIFKLARQSAMTGEPVARHMEYVFPHQGFEKVNDQFMLGDSIIVAPVLKQNAAKRIVRFPAGKWQGEDGKIVNGPANLEIVAPLERLPRFKLKDY